MVSGSEICCFVVTRVSLDKGNHLESNHDIVGCTVILCLNVRLVLCVQIFIISSSLVVISNYQHNRIERQQKTEFTTPELNMMSKYFCK